MRLDRTLVNYYVPGSSPIGKPLYISDAPGKYSLIPPSGSEHYIRIVGHVMEFSGTDYIVHFNPDPTWAQLA